MQWPGLFSLLLLAFSFRQGKISGTENIEKPYSFGEVIRVQLINSIPIFFFQRIIYCLLYMPDAPLGTGWSPCLQVSGT